MSRVDPKPADVCAGALLANLAEMFEEAAARNAGLSFTSEATALFGRASREALHHVYALQMRAQVADEMEAVARDLDLISHAKTGEIGASVGPAIGPKMGEVVCLREHLADAQRLIQADLDAEDTAHPAAKGRAEDAYRHDNRIIGITPFLGVRFKPHDGGDAA